LLASAHRQPFLTIDPLNPLPVDRMALAPQQDVQAAVAEPATLLGEGPQDPDDLLFREP
jgi:hypothetical protein